MSLDPDFELQLFTHTHTLSGTSPPEIHTPYLACVPADQPLERLIGQLHTAPCPSLALAAGPADEVLPEKLTQHSLQVAGTAEQH